MTSGQKKVAVIDVGKTNVKLALVDAALSTEIAVSKLPNDVVSGPPWPHFAVDDQWEFILNGLKNFQAEHGVDAIAATTHGASAALLARDGSLAAPVLDYEFGGPNELADEYNAIRPDFAETGSPRLSMGLNLGAQLHWQFATVPGLKERTATIVTYPQYWSFRLSGVVATEFTSLGAHTDLWNPYEGRPTGLVKRLGISTKLAPTRKPDDALGPVLPEVAARTGLEPNTQVLCGIHDSNASLLPYLLGETPPFSVVSTGTWVVAMSMGAAEVPLDPARDTLVNVNALGQPVRSAKFMGGREYEIVSAGQSCNPGSDDAMSVLKRGIMLMPSVVPETGPFQGSLAKWAGGEPQVGGGQRAAALAYYLALMTAECLSLTGHRRGDVIVEGPFAQNRLFLQMLKTACGCAVRVARGQTGTCQGVAVLASGLAAPLKTDAVQTAELDAPLLVDYAREWRQNLPHARIQL